MASDQQTTDTQSSDLSSTASDLYQKATDTVSSVGSSIGSAISDDSTSGKSLAESTATDASQGAEMTKEQADKLYEENIQLEYEKREGGA